MVYQWFSPTTSFITLENIRENYCVLDFISQFLFLKPSGRRKQACQRIFLKSEINRNWSCDYGFKVIFQGWMCTLTCLSVAPERQNQSSRCVPLLIWTVPSLWAIPWPVNAAVEKYPGPECCLSKSDSSHWPGQFPNQKFLPITAFECSPPLPKMESKP